MAKLKMKCFRSTRFLTVDFLYPVLIFTASFQIFGNRMPEQRGPTRQNTEALNTADHSRHSSCREMLIEHLFVGEVMRHVWVSGGKRLEILKPQVDDGGYDLVLETGSVLRHIQLKTSFEGSSGMQCNQQGGGATVYSNRADRRAGFQLRPWLRS